MSDPTATYQPVPGAPAAPTVVSTPAPAPGSTTASSSPSGGGHRGPLDDVKVERPRTHPLTYLALALGTLALILSLAALTRHDGGGYRQVKIGGHECVIGEQNGADILYCQTSSVP
jgi:hypothetical protein